MKKIISKFFAYLILFGFIMSEKSELFQKLIFRPVSMFFIKWAVRDWKKGGGVKAWESFHKPLWYEAGRVRSSHLKKVMKMNPNNALSVGSYHDYEDPKFGIEGHWEVSGADYAVRLETKCKFGDYLHEVNCPDLCRILIVEFEKGTVEPISDFYYFEPFDELISAGDTNCRIIHHIRKT